MRWSLAGCGHEGLCVVLRRRCLAGKGADPVADVLRWDGAQRGVVVSGCALSFDDWFCAGRAIGPVGGMLRWDGAQRGVDVSGCELFFGDGGERGRTSVLWVRRLASILRCKFVYYV